MRIPENKYIERIPFSYQPFWWSWLVLNNYFVKLQSCLNCWATWTNFLEFVYQNSRFKSPSLISILFQCWGIRRTKLGELQTLETSLSRGKRHRLFFALKKMSNLRFHLVRLRSHISGRPVAVCKFKTVKQTVNYNFVFSLLQQLSGWNRLWSIECSCKHGGLCTPGSRSFSKGVNLIDNDF